MTRLRIVFLLCCLVFAFALVACGSNDTADPGSDTTDQSDAASTESTVADDSSDDDGATDASSAYLTPADIEQVTGMSGIVLVPRDPSIGAGGTLNFATSEGELVTLLSVFSADDYEMAKGTEGWAAEEVTGLGDDAFLGPEGSPYYLYFSSGDLGFGLSSFFDLSGGTYLSMDQLKELAAIVLSRI